MLVLEDAREEVSLIVVLLLSVRRNWKLENLACRGDVGIECKTGRGEASTGGSALVEGRKQLNGMVYVCNKMCSGAVCVQLRTSVGIN